MEGIRGRGMTPTAVLITVMIFAGLMIFPGTLALTPPVESIVLVSDGTVHVIELDNQAIATYMSWQWPSLDGATWIWATTDGNNLVDNISEFGPFTFVKQFSIASGALCSGSLQITADNAYEATLNGQLIGSDGNMTTEPYADTLVWQTIKQYDITPGLREGSNDISVKAVNYLAETKPNGSYWGVDPYSNPAGLLFRADITCTLPFHNLAVTGVNALPTKAVPGDLVSIVVTVENQGGFQDDAKVTPFYDATEAAPPQTISLDPGTNATFSFSWNSSGVAAGDYAISASVGTVPGEPNTSDNILAGPKVTLTYRILSAELSGQLDYLLNEPIPIRIAAAVTDVSSSQQVSGATVTIDIYDGDGVLWVASTMVEKPAGSGTYEWSSGKTIGELGLQKGVYKAVVKASYRDGPASASVLLFHIDPPAATTNPPGNGSRLWPLTPVTLAVLAAEAGGVLALVYYMVRRRGQTPASREDAFLGTTCPHCGAATDVGSAYCPRCGSNLFPPPPGD